MAGLDFLDLLTGYDRAIIVDAIQTREGKAGQVYRLEPEVFEATRHASTSHGVNFATALELGKRLGLALPPKIVIFAVEVENVCSCCIWYITSRAEGTQFSQSIGAMAAPC